MPSPVAPVPPTLIFLHHLGGSAETWSQVERELSDRHACLRLDLPGFGGHADRGGSPVGAMADQVAARVAEAGLARWVLVGHSMSAKVALLIARRAEDGVPSLAGLCGLVLAAGSPPAPEPMTDGKRQEMLGWFEGDAQTSRAEADGFVRANVAAPLDDATHAGAVDDVLRASVPAWRDWLTGGSREDLRDAVGVVRLPTLVLSGAEDGPLGRDAQLRLTMPHLARARHETVEGAAHLLPLERPDRVAALIVAHVEAIARAEVLVSEAGRMTARTRAALERRGAADDPAYRPQAMPAPSLAVLRAVAARVLPQRGTQIDLAARIDAMLHQGGGDGWRFAALPPDAEAYRAALRTLDGAALAAHGRGFAALDGAAQDGLLRAVAAGSPGSAATPPAAADGLDGAAMERWFEDLRADAVRLFMAHPATLALLRCEAPATGGDAELTGFAPYRAVDSSAGAAT